MIRLVKPTEKMAEEIFAYKKEMLENNEDLHGCSFLEDYNDVAGWLEKIASYSDKNNKNFDNYLVEGTHFVLINENNRILGMINIRHELNEYLLSFGGHIGYSVRPSERIKGYAKKQLGLAVDFLRNRGVFEILITCSDTNIASYKTIESCGGILENIVQDKNGRLTRRYWIKKSEN
ncbi:MAG: GNAT family N-acetyltransferase [Acholeplasma sp.]|nr:GNAT family N-acetyltransferase [Acholeplasma sp.]